MKKIKIMVCLTALLLGLSQAASVMAAESGSIVYEENAQNFVTNVSGDEFDGIRPGETRSMTLSLENSSAESMKFYISGEILENIAASGSKNAIYDFTITKGKETSPFFAAVIGGGSRADNISVGAEYLTSDNQILLDTLSKGEKVDITITLSLDGDSADNTYMEQQGTIQLTFMADTLASYPPIRVIDYITGTASHVINVVRTGDVLPYMMVFCLALIAGAGGIFLFIRRKQVRQEIEKEGRKDE